MEQFQERDVFDLVLRLGRSPLRLSESAEQEMGKTVNSF